MQNYNKLKKLIIKSSQKIKIIEIIEIFTNFSYKILKLIKAKYYF